jgi:hypothetical protein
MSEESWSISPSNTPPKKKKKLQYKQVCLKKWEEIFAWVALASSEDPAFCKLCNKNFSISHDGQFDVKQHVLYKGHQQKGKGNVGVNKLRSYFVSANNPEYDSVTVCELELI